ncbi:MAG: hypothetical protein V3S24_15370 [Candidatus Tectomicrobia bacterium]
MAGVLDNDHLGAGERFVSRLTLRKPVFHQEWKELTANNARCTWKKDSHPTLPHPVKQSSIGYLCRSDA